MYIAPRRWKLERLTTSVASYPVRIRDWWSVQTGTNRIVYGAIASALVLALVLFAALRFRGPDYAVLFSNLQPDEANAVVQKLDALLVDQLVADQDRRAAVGEAVRRSWSPTSWSTRSASSSPVKASSKRAAAPGSS